MSVYVDDMKAVFGRMVMCHMIADSSSELLSMADRIGIRRRWLQKIGTYKEHFDICLSKKGQAIRFGAIQVTQRQLVEIVRKRRRKCQLLIS